MKSLFGTSPITRKVILSVADNATGYWLEAIFHSFPCFSNTNSENDDCDELATGDKTSRMVAGNEPSLIWFALSIRFAPKSYATTALSDCDWLFELTTAFTKNGSPHMTRDGNSMCDKTYGQLPSNWVVFDVNRPRSNCRAFDVSMKPIVTPRAMGL
jgi:hypothetical protein